MKTRTALPLIYALGCLMVSVSSAQIPLAPLTPDNLRFSLDTAFVTYDLSQTVQSQTISGTVQNLNTASSDFKVKIQTSRQWRVQIKVGGVVIQDGDPINLGSSEAVEITLLPHAVGPDTESYCVSFMYGSKPTPSAQQCITLAVTNNISAVSTDLPNPNIILVPNPAGRYIFVHGLSDALAGYRYEIFSISGAEVRHRLLPADGRINVQDLPSGAYRLLLFDAKRTLSNTAFTVLH